MVYMGSKAKLEDFIVPTLQQVINHKGINTYIEPFVGGANVIDKITCQTRIGYDLSKTLIALLVTARDDFNKIPSNGDREWFEKARAIYRGKSNEQMEDYLIGAIQWLGSYGTRGFPGGFAPPKNGKDYYKERFNNLKKQSLHLSNIEFYQKNYLDITIPNNSLIYCDPPYQDTKAYGYAFENKFDHEEYWNWVRQNSEQAYIICSEENFPSDFLVIKERQKRRTVGANNKKVATEKLGIYSQGKMADLWKEINK